MVDLKAVVHVRPGAKSLKHRQLSHLSLLVQGNQVRSGIRGGFFIFFTRAKALLFQVNLH